MTPKQDDTPEPAVKTPTAAQIASAVDGTLNSSGVVLRAGPSQTYSILGKYSSGTQLKVYEASGDYFYVRVVKENLVGYIAAKVVDNAGIVPGENATPSPKAIAEPSRHREARQLALRRCRARPIYAYRRSVKGDVVLITLRRMTSLHSGGVPGREVLRRRENITASTTVPTEHLCRIKTDYRQKTADEGSRFTLRGRFRALFSNSR
jgi:hypothetical protein